MPGDIRACFNKVVPAPHSGPLSKKDIAELIAELHKSDVAKTQCGKRLIIFYENQAKRSK